MPSWGGLPRVTLLVCIMRSVHAGGNTCESTDGNGQQCGGTASVLKDAHQYCIIGAGPGGLQLGQQFLRQGVDYVTLEREARPGAFFETFPRHRTLISINKRFTGRADREFNLRHDWNSLLDNEEAVPVTNRTASRWPHADVLVGYLRDYARAQERAGRIAYERTVSRLTKQGDGAFSMDLADKDGAVSRLRCQYVVVATGLFKPNRPGDIPGLNLTMDYADLPEQSSSFEGKTVAVLGAGNAGFEVANDMAPYVNYVHVFAGRGVTQENELLSFESRYVGNVRAINAALLDSYLLKSLDGGLSPSFPARIMSIFECGLGGKKRCMFPKHHDDPTFVSIGTFSRTDDEAVEFVTGVRHHVKLERVSWGPTVLQVDMRRRHEELPKNYLVQNEQYQVYLNTSYLGAATMDAVLEFARKSGTPFPLEYDVIVSCLGWVMDLDLFGDTARPWMQSGGKFPVVNERYESVNVPGLFFAGVVSHGKDYKRSAGGFIHGFRYTARALARILGKEHRGVPWEGEARFSGVDSWTDNDGLYPGRPTASPSAGFGALLNHLFRRIDTASGPYQMVSVLGDGAVFACPDRSRLDATYLEEVPTDYFSKAYSRFPRLQWMFGYNQQRRPLHRSMSDGTVFQVFMWWHPGNCDGTPVEGERADLRTPQLLRVFESFHTEWDVRSSREDVAKWLLPKLQGLVRSKGTRWEDGEEYEIVPTIEDKGQTDKRLKLAVASELSREEFYPGQIKVFITNLANETVQVQWGNYQGTVLSAGHGTSFDAVDGDVLYVHGADRQRLMEPRELHVWEGIVQQVVVPL